MEILWKGPILTIAFFLIVLISLTATPTKQSKKQEQKLKIYKQEKKLKIYNQDFKQETYHPFEWKEVK